MEEFKERINLNVELSELSKAICEKYKIGKYISDEIIMVGYEDFNYILQTSEDKYCVKVFNKERTDEDCKIYVERIELANTLDINTPKVLKINNNSQLDILLNGVKYRLCVFEYIDGKSFFDLGITPSDIEIKEIIRQMAIIHSSALNSKFIYDKWAIINFEKEMKLKSKYLNKQDRIRLEKLLEKFVNIDFKKLPNAFVHGDIISTNCLKDKNNKLWIIDFAVSNYLPRIIDLAVSACNLCLDADDKEKTISNIRMIVKEYQKYNKLTDYEIECLPILFEVGNAMCILQISYMMNKNEISLEDKFWYEASVQGLNFSCNEFWNEIWS